MKITVRQAIESKNALEELLNIELDGTIGFTIYKNKKALLELIEYYNLELYKIYDKYCEKDTTGKLIYNQEKNAYKVSEKSQKSFQEAIEHLLSVSFDVDLTCLSANKLVEYRFRPYIFENLDFMILDDIENNIGKKNG